MLIDTIREVRCGEVHFEKAGVNGVAVWVPVVSPGSSEGPRDGIKQERVKVV